MKISLIVAMDEANGIGLQGRLPWRLSSDLQHFKKLTYGHHMIMGRKTWESIGRALPGRVSIVITRQPGYQATGCICAQSLEAAIAVASAQGETEVFIIGGGMIYRQAIRLADRIYLTRVHTWLQTDTFFPEIDWTAWEIVQSIEFAAGPKDEHPFTIFYLQRKNA